MRAVVQRARRAHVEVEGATVGAIDLGLVAFVGAGEDDDERDADYLANKILGLRVFPDASGKMSLAVGDVGGELLVVSQFTLFGDVRRGMRPSFDRAMAPERAEGFFEGFLADLRRRGARVATGRFRAHMRVHVDNDGPVTVLLDSKKLF